MIPTHDKHLPIIPPGRRQLRIGAAMTIFTNAQRRQLASIDGTAAITVIAAVLH